MAQQVLDGNDYLLEVDFDTPTSEESGQNYHPILCEVSSTFAIMVDELQISNGCNKGWRASRPNQSSFSFSGEWQAINPRTGEPDAVSINVIARLAAEKRVFWIRRKLKEGSLGAEVYREGRVWISQYEDTTTVEEPFTFSAQFVGVGDPIISAGYDYIGLLHDSQRKPIQVEDSFIQVKV